MKLEVGCNCGTLRHVAEGDPALQAQRHCRACQHIAGDAPRMFMLIPADRFLYTKCKPKTFTRPDKENAVRREFCAECGTHLTTRRPGLPPVVLKIGALDDSTVFTPKMAIYTENRQAFHVIPAGIPVCEKLPTSR